jgi:hypothetical protein
MDPRERRSGRQVERSEQGSDATSEATLPGAPVGTIHDSARSPAPATRVIADITAADLVRVGGHDDVAARPVRG